MSSNVIYKGFDNPIIFTFSFSGDFAALGLNNFTRIDVTIGSETYSTTGQYLAITDANTLTLSISDVTNLADGSYGVEIIGFNSTYDDGFVLACKKARTLTNVRVISC